MSIFNKNRIGILSKKGIYKYLFYGLGEIILVVIGILIAVNINNRNEQSASEKRLKSYLQVYHQDMVQDTLVINSVLKYTEDRKEFFNLFLSDSVEAKHYLEKPQGLGLVLSYSPFKLQQKGISLLDNYVNDNEVEQDTLISKILANHKAFDNLINETNTRISEDISDNMNYLKGNEPWIADLLLGNINNPDMLPYFLSDSYRARLAVHSTLIYGNLVPILNQLKINHIKIFEELNKRMDK